MLKKLASKVAVRLLPVVAVVVAQVILTGQTATKFRENLRRTADALHSIYDLTEGWA